VAGVLAAVAIASTRRPLLRLGQRGVTAGLAALGNLHLVVAAAIILVGLLAAIVGTVDAPQQWLDAVPVLKVIGVAALALTVLLPPFRRTAARWLAIVAALFLLPNTLAAVLGDSVPDFAPTPVQVTIVLVAVALALAVTNLVRPGVRPALVVRLAVVPIVAVHAGWLLPAVWTQFGLALTVVVIVVTLVLLQPVPDEDDRVHGRRVLTGAGTQLLALGVALVAAPSLLDDASLVVLGLIWLTVVVVAALCFETVERLPTDSPEAVPTPPG
jgi:hypothetical protein